MEFYVDVMFVFVVFVEIYLVVLFGRFLILMFVMAAFARTTSLSLSYAYFILVSFILIICFFFVNIIEYVCLFCGLFKLSIGVVFVWFILIVVNVGAFIRSDVFVMIVVIFCGVIVMFFLLCMYVSVLSVFNIDVVLYDFILFDV